MKKVSVKNKIIFGFTLILLTSGCGLKGNPVSTSTALHSPGEQKLTASAEENTVLLTWQLQNQDGKIRYINIEKSELGSAGNICKDCPRVFERIGLLKIVDVKNEYRFTDQSVKRGKIYSYRLKLCDEDSICRESSAVEIDFKK